MFIRNFNMKNLTLKNILVALTIFVIFVNNGSNANTIVVEAIKNDPDKELVARQLKEIRCTGHFDGDKIRKAFTEINVGMGIVIPKNAIYATLTTECNNKSVKVKVDSPNSKLEKFVGNQFVPMGSFPVQSLGNTGVSPRTFGQFVIERFLLWADPSECLNATSEGLLGIAQICASFILPAGYETTYETPCAKQPSIIDGCPQDSSPDAILIEKLNELMEKVAGYLGLGTSRLEKVKPLELKETAKKFAECFKNIALTINVTVNENDNSCASCNEIDALSNINKESELPEDRMQIVLSLLKKLKDASECKFDICLFKNDSCIVENKENEKSPVSKSPVGKSPFSNDGISRFSGSALMIIGIILYVMINQ